MKKRLTCGFLALALLLSLMPMPASAAGMSITEAGITILKQLEGYKTTCNANGYTGYGTLCQKTGIHGGHKIDEELADEALRIKLKELDAAVNAFASSKGISLDEYQHDALVIFSFENGTAWTTGTGDFQAAIASGSTGNTFLNAICWWNKDTSDDNRRMIEANMYLNKVRNSTVPSQFIRVEFHPNGGTMEEAEYQYYDASTTQGIALVPTRSYYRFLGWYTNDGTQVTSVTQASDGNTFYAKWHHYADEPWASASTPANVKPYKLYASQLGSLIAYYKPNGSYMTVTSAGVTLPDYFLATETVEIDHEYIDYKGNRWGRVSSSSDKVLVGKWVLLRNVSGIAAGSAGTYIDVTVTVTNDFVRSRVNADIHSAQNGTYHKGDMLRIINTEENGNYLWGQVAKSTTDNTPIGWVALMYTNFESVRNGTGSGSGVVVSGVTATITYKGYVNVRSDAGTHNRIVGALPTGTTVEITQTKYVNGIQWGLCQSGWFCLAYAKVDNLTESSSQITEVGFVDYVFTGWLQTKDTVKIYEEPSYSAEIAYDDMLKLTQNTVTITNLTNVTNPTTNDVETWGKTPYGWVRVSDSQGNILDVDLATAKFQVIADTLTVRASASAGAQRLDTLKKGVEFNVNVAKQIIVVGETIWGWADKVGEGNKTYNGWVNLANKNVTRNDAPKAEDDKNNGTTVTGLVGTVINTNSLKVRSYGATYGTIIGSLALGTTVIIWEANEDNSWYKVDSNGNGVYDYEGDGWVSASYLNVYEGTVSGGSSDNGTGGITGSTSQTGMGVVANTYTGVNVRTGPSTGYDIVGKLLPGTAVEILETNGNWGRMAQGWVCLDYIAMISYYPIGGSGNGGATGGDVTDNSPAIYTGSVTGSVNVYKDTTVAYDKATGAITPNSDVVRTLSANDPITMHEILTVVTEVITNQTSTSTTTEKVTTYWIRINDGYIFNPQHYVALNALDEDVYTVTGSEVLNVRSAAGTSGTSILHRLMKYDRVVVTKLQIVDGVVWGYIENDKEKTYLTDEDGNQIVGIEWNGEGWISLKYATKGVVTDPTVNNNNSSTTNPGTDNNGTVGGETGTQTPGAPVMGNGSDNGGFVNNTSGYRYTGTVIRTGSLRVRSTPSTSASVTTNLSKGQALVIYETTISEEMAWGRCDAGWVYLYYVDLVPVSTTGAVDARVVYNENTLIYTDMNGSEIAGTYEKMAVIDIFEIVDKMARTNKGWVNTDNLL